MWRITPAEMLAGERSNAGVISIPSRLIEETRSHRGPISEAK